MVAPLVFIKKKVESTILRQFHFFDHKNGETRFGLL